MSPSDLSTLKKAGAIASQTVAFARSLIKPQMPLLEIAETIEAHIAKLGAQPAFPVNLSINEIAAHATPAHDDKSVAHGLLKVDIGVHIDGFVADTAFSLDLENSQENRALIAAAEAALASATALVIQEKTPQLRAIGRSIAAEIQKRGFQPIRNLSGHSIARWDLHAGLSIPNFDNASERSLSAGIYAIEPFVTLATGAGIIRDGKPSGIYALQKQANVRDAFSRSLLQHIQETYQTLPFCARWLVKRFGTRALLALSLLQKAGILHHYAHLVELNKNKVAQAEHTLVITEKEVVVITA